MPYDERIRDPLLVSTLADEGLSDETVSLIVLDTLQSFFMDADNFTTKVMRNRDPALTWTDDKETTAIRIVRAIDWRPENMGQTPEVIVRNQGSTWKNNDVGGVIERSVNERIDDPDVVSNHIMSRTVIWAISTSGTETRNIAWEIGTFFSAFAQPLQKEYGFQKLAVAGVGTPVRIKERKNYWGCPCVLAAQWQLTQELIEQQPRLAEVLMTPTPADEGWEDL